MKRLVAAIILIPLAIVIVALAVANRHPVMVSLDPFNGDAPAAAITLPLYALVFATLVVGIVVGGAAVWFSQGRWRRRARTLKRESKTILRENERFKASASPNPATLLPVPRRDAA